MKSLPFHKCILGLISLMLMHAIPYSLSAQNENQEHPNIVWIVTEDNSKHYLKLYEEHGVEMPNIEALARKGIVFNHAFSQGPVCSVARSTLISGCYAPRIGAQYHRRAALVPPQDGLKMFPWYLRKAGYYTSNNSKEDYNLIKSDEVWDESSRSASYRNRKAGQPFFHVQNFGITHEGRLHFSKEQMEKNPTKFNPDYMQPWPYQPDTEITRYTIAKYWDQHQKADAQIGDFLHQLENDGLIENTIIFYYGDHGGVLPRSKGYLYETGVHVPLVVYVPEKWQHLSPVGAGKRTDAFVSFIDFGPTVMNLAGVEVPEAMDGRPFLGNGVSTDMLAERNTAFSYADRFDEKYDLVRGFRKGKYKYIRNYQPFNVDALQNNYRYRMMMFEEWRDLYQAGKLDENQSQFFEQRPSEALYDIEADPFEVNNLANDPAYAEVLKDLRKGLQQQVKSMPDLSFIPEPYFLSNGLENPVAFGQAHKEEIGELIETADLALEEIEVVEKRLKKALKAKDPHIRYWAWIVCTSFGEDASMFYDYAAKKGVNDPNNLVAVRAAEFLALSKGEDMREELLSSLRKAQSLEEANLMLNTITLLHDITKYKFEIDSENMPKEWFEEARSNVARRVAYLTGEGNL